MGSRRIEDLHPEAQQAARQHLLLCADAGIELLIYCTFRDAAEQARLFHQGRTAQQVRQKADQLQAAGFPQLAELLRDTVPQPGAKVTFAGPGESFHQYNAAYDCVPLFQGRPVWSTTGSSATLWRKVGELGQQCGLEWAGTWTRFREFPHFQLTGGRNVRDLMQERFGSGGAPAGGAAAFGLAAAEGEDAGLRAALAEANTVFLVYAAHPGVDAAALRASFETAGMVARNLSPDVWRTFLSEDPASLTGDLAGLLWPGGDIAPVVLLGTGTGLARPRIRSFQLADLPDALAITGAFSQG